MVVLAASIITKSGKALFSRQFDFLSRPWIEGYLQAFPKLIEIGKQHTHVETENVRYVYQPIESLYLLIITDKQSNILEDLEILTQLSKLVREYSYCVDENGIGEKVFEINFAFDEVISLGHKENVTVEQVKQYCKMDSCEEKSHNLVLKSKIDKTNDVMKRKASEIDKSKIENNRGERGGFMGSGRIDTGFGSATPISGSTGGFGSRSGFGQSTEVECFSTKPEGCPPASVSAPPAGIIHGMQLLGRKQNADRFLESLKAEGEVIVEDVRPSISQSRPAASPQSHTVTLTVEEKLHVTLKQDGGIRNFDLHGILSLHLLNEDDGFVQVQIETGNTPGILFRTHPDVNKELFSNEHILGYRDPSGSFSVGQTGLVRWRMQSVDESLVPLSISCWPTVSKKETSVNLEYEALKMFDLQDVVISIPLPAIMEAPRVPRVDGKWRYDSVKSILEWSIVLIDDSNRSGIMEFTIPAVDTSELFPISVRFTSASTFSNLKVVDVLPVRDGKPPKYSQRTLLSTETYQIV
ncbi:hypothetical protein OROMI_027975 [Orobanche minor]